MAAIQGAINSMLGSASHAVKTVQSYAAKAISPITGATAGAIEMSATASRISAQQLAAQRAAQSSRDAIQAKTAQRQKFAGYLTKQVDKEGDETWQA